MDFKGFISTLLSGLCNVENCAKYSFKFSQKELNEILHSARPENVRFLQDISKIEKLSAFEISFLLSSTSLSEEKIETIKKAVKLFDEKEFSAQGQTFSDFIFRVSANIDALNSSNIELFKELAQCRNDIYDFTQVLKNPARFTKKRNSKKAFAFERVLM